jgi:hypothetical protein
MPVAISFPRPTINRPDLVEQPEALGIGITDLMLPCIEGSSTKTVTLAPGRRRPRGTNLKMHQGGPKIEVSVAIPTLAFLCPSTLSQPGFLVPSDAKSPAAGRSFL